MSNKELANREALADFNYLMQNFGRYHILPQATQQFVFDSAIALLASKSLTQEQEGQLRRAKDQVLDTVGLGEK